jgi:D-serine deaminase-like pyridoxal phosphate-dependent protein
VNGLQVVLNLIMSGGLVTAGVMLYRARSEKLHTNAQTTKTGADAIAVISDTAVEMLAPLRAELRAAHDDINQLRGEVRSVRAELDEYHRRYGPLKPAAASD